MDVEEFLERSKGALIRVVNLKKYYPVRGGVFRRTKAWVKAVDNVSLWIRTVSYTHLTLPTKA